MVASIDGLHGTSLGYNASMDSCSLILGRRVTGGGGQMPNSMAMAVSPLTNQLSGAGYAYDVLGNLVTMPAADGVGTVSMTYLDQGHIGTLTDAAGVVWKYYYDADGKRRIKVKTAGGAATEPDGQGGVRLVADRSYYFYEGEDLICQQDVGALVQDESQYEPKFLLLDHLGSTRAELVFTESGGVFSPVIQEYYDLMPYGEVIDPPTTQESVLFTGKSRDQESGLDFFGARFYTNQTARWNSPDIPFKDNRLEDPSSWNLYNYVRNNPISNIDPNGQEKRTSANFDSATRRMHVFVAFSKEQMKVVAEVDRSIVVAEPPKFDRLLNSNKDVGVALYTEGDVNGANWASAIGESGAIAIMVNHGSGPNPGAIPFVADGLRFPGFDSDASGGVDVKASTIGIFTCDSKSMLTDFKFGGIAVGVDSGANGGTTSDALGRAGFNFSMSLLKGRSIDTAVAAANLGLDTPNGFPRDNANIGDRVIRLMNQPEKK